MRRRGKDSEMGGRASECVRYRLLPVRESSETLDGERAKEGWKRKEGRKEGCLFDEAGREKVKRWRSEGAAEVDQGPPFPKAALGSGLSGQKWAKFLTTPISICAFRVLPTCEGGLRVSAKCKRAF